MLRDNIIWLLLTCRFCCFSELTCSFPQQGQRTTFLEASACSPFPSKCFVYAKVRALKSGGNPPPPPATAVCRSHSFTEPHQHSPSSSSSPSSISSSHNARTEAQAHPQTRPHQAVTPTSAEVPPRVSTGPTGDAISAWVTFNTGKSSYDSYLHFTHGLLYESTNIFAYSLSCGVILRCPTP